MRTHREPSLEGCTAEMQPGRPSFEAPHGARCAPWLAPQDDGYANVPSLPCKFGLLPLRRERPDPSLHRLTFLPPPSWMRAQNGTTTFHRGSGEVDDPGPEPARGFGRSVVGQCRRVRQGIFMTFSSIFAQFVAFVGRHRAAMAKAVGHHARAGLGPGPGHSRSQAARRAADAEDADGPGLERGPEADGRARAQGQRVRDRPRPSALDRGAAQWRRADRGSDADRGHPEVGVPLRDAGDDAARRGARRSPPTASRCCATRTATASRKCAAPSWRTSASRSAWRWSATPSMSATPTA